jgi:hypothetical protein
MKYWRHNWTDLRNLATTSFLPNFFRLHSRKYTETRQEELCEAPLADGTIIEGTFDCVGKYDGILTLSDWKTSSKAYPVSKILKNPQMYMYAEMYRHRYGVLPQQIQYKVFRKDNGSIQTLTETLTEEKLKLQLDEVSRIIKTINHMTETGDFYHNFNCFCKE